MKKNDLIKGILLSLLAIHFANLSAQISRVEPANWFVGMKNNQLQLLIYGNKIGETIPTVKYPGVVIKKINKADSENYLFIDIEIAPSTQPGTIDFLFKKQNKTIHTYQYNLFQRKTNPLELKGFTSADVIYLLVPDRFANGDENNDAIPTMKEKLADRKTPFARHGGDIQGIIQNLDYIKEMGFTAIWSTPILENNMPQYSYHGYAITDHYKVDQRFGNLNDYIELSQKAKQKGIKLIFDEVLNHTGLHYWWMNDLPFKNWINKNDSLVITTHKRTTNQDMYASAYDKDLMTNGWFVESMPDLNNQHPLLANYLIQKSLWWIETLQLGGIRQDTYGYSNKNFLKNWTTRIMTEYPNFSIVGEEWSFNPLITSYWQKGKINHDNYQSNLTTIMDFPTQMVLTEALKETETPYANKGLIRLYENLANDFVYANPHHLMIFADNHDMDRVYTALKNDLLLTKMAMAYLLTIRGIPQIYYGTEILMNNDEAMNHHGYIRKDFPGGWKTDTVNAFTGKGLTPQQLEMQNYLKQILQWRKKNEVIAKGKTLHFAPFDQVYVYFRYDHKKMVMVVVNKNEKETTIELKRFDEVLRNKTKAKNIITQKTVTLQKELLVDGKTTSIFEIE